MNRRTEQQTDQCTNLSSPRSDFSFLHIPKIRFSYLVKGFFKFLKILDDRRIDSPIDQPISLILEMPCGHFEMWKKPLFHKKQEKVSHIGQILDGFVGAFLSVSSLISIRASLIYCTRTKSVRYTEIEHLLQFWLFGCNGIKLLA